MNITAGLIGLFAALLLAVPGSPAHAAENRPPNIIVILADDLGYGDLSVYGHPSIATPSLDRMAQEGQRWTDFYVASGVCTPSRASLLTGRYPVRTGLSGGVLFEWSASGLDPQEVTIAEMLKSAGYATGMVGKWHLGHKHPFLPTDQGFDSYFGIPFSNDLRIDYRMPYAKDVKLREGMTLERMTSRGQKVDDWVPLMEGDLVVEYPCEQSTLTQRYTQRCLSFIDQNRDRPFFFYFAHSAPHVPLHASSQYLGSSRRGLYGDVVEEIDDSVGQILTHLHNTGLDTRTLVVFTSDNGPWATKKERGGSAGLLRGAKGMTYEGGVRVPAIFWWPGRVQPGTTVRDIGSTLDLMATFAHLANKSLPTGRPLDSLDLSGAMLEGQPSQRHSMVYYRGDEIYAIRQGDWKAEFITEGWLGIDGAREVHPTPLLYNLGEDPSERYDRSAEHPDIIKEMRGLKARYEAEITPAPSRLLETLDYQDIPDWAQNK
jgi:arylsulfatase A-like enzyme